jgi:phosphate starvation-inducible PhoH-like protein
MDTTMLEQKEQKEKVKKTIELEDNTLAQNLFGKSGENVKRLEKKLGVELNTRGNVVNIEGGSEDVLLTERLINELYGLLEKGYPFYTTDLDYAIRVISGDRKVRLADVFMDTIYVSFKKRSIAPKSIGQKRYIDAIRCCDIVFSIGPAGTGKTYRVKPTLPWPPRFRPLQKKRWTGLFS